MVSWGVWRPVTGRVVIKMPYAKGNRAWLKETLGDRIRPDFRKPPPRWEVARIHFAPVVQALANRLGRIDVYVDFRTAEQCDTRCRNARGQECTCSCLGRQHGRGITYGWNLVGDTTMVQSSGTVRRHLVVGSSEISNGSDDVSLVL